MLISTMLTCATRQSWRSWLRKHHSVETEIWLVFYKKRAGVAGISYEEAVEEALCFGWIDGILKKIDDKNYVRRFTPRQAGSSWSATNIGRMKRLMDEGRMTEDGLRVFDTALFGKALPVNPGRRISDIPEWIKQSFRANKNAWHNFNALPPSQRRLYLGWILDAKKEETRHRRLAEAVSRLEKNLPLGMK